jgi:hypothetical protein
VAVWHSHSMLGDRHITSGLRSGLCTATVAWRLDLSADFRKPGTRSGVYVGRHIVRLHSSRRQVSRRRSTLLQRQLTIMEKPSLALLLCLPVVPQGWGENDRGVSYTFGPDCVTDFLQRHDLDLVCRAHQVSRQTAVLGVSRYRCGRPSRSQPAVQHIWELEDSSAGACWVCCGLHIPACLSAAQGMLLC